jgi:hypothetical protein
MFEGERGIESGEEVEEGDGVAKTAGRMQDG